MGYASDLCFKEEEKYPKRYWPQIFSRESSNG